ncbi:MAG: SH3 domain-containing protein, partial [Alphaproteobacteria bacterium]
MCDYLFFRRFSAHRDHSGSGRAPAAATIRAGPGKSYPINWVYTRKALPVEIIKEYDQWRYVRDIDGAEGWIHRTLLSGSRSVIVSGVIVRTAYDGPSRDDATVFQAEPGVQGSLITCD